MTLALACRLCGWDYSHQPPEVTTCISCGTPLRLRAGRLSVTYRPDLPDPVVLVVPEDGSEPIELRISEIEISAAAGDAARAEVVLFLHSLDLSDEHGQSVRANPQGHPVVFPNLEFDHDEGADADPIDGFLWRWSADRRRRWSPTLTFRRVALPRK